MLTTIVEFDVSLVEDGGVILKIFAQKGFASTLGIVYGHLQIVKVGFLTFVAGRTNTESYVTQAQYSLGIGIGVHQRAVDIGAHIRCFARDLDVVGLTQNVFVCHGQSCVVIGKCSAEISMSANNRFRESEGVDGPHQISIRTSGGEADGCIVVDQGHVGLHVIMHTVRHLLLPAIATRALYQHTAILYTSACEHLQVGLFEILLV